MALLSSERRLCVAGCDGASRLRRAQPAMQSRVTVRARVSARDARSPLRFVCAHDDAYRASAAAVMAAWGRGSCAASAGCHEKQPGAVGWRCPATLASSTSTPVAIMKHPGVRHAFRREMPRLPAKLSGLSAATRRRLRNGIHCSSAL